jgi:HPt (histidine-containing phosphotransfer) domain-containing protein
VELTSLSELEAQPLLPQQAGVDVTELLARVEDDRELLREVLDIFSREMPRLEREMRDALTFDDMDRARLTAHTMKGMLSSLSFSRATESARRIEQMAREVDQQGIAAELFQMEQHIVVAQAAVEELCAERTS